MCMRTAYALHAIDNLSEAERANIVRLHKQYGLGTATLAERSGITTGTISELARKAGLKPPKSEHW
jgi:hypothetical protein